MDMVAENHIINQPPFALDSKDFETLFQQQYEPQVRRAFLLVGSMAAAQDVVAESFTKLHAKWDGVDQPERYLKRSVMNACRDWGRKRARWRRLVDDGVDGEAINQLAEKSDGFGMADLADSLANLPYRQRAAIVLQFYGNESQDSIAELLGCRPGTVGSLIHRGLKQLREDLS